ncbi:hypothetical protein QTP70_026037 [Hemibagrus guttatus]|uniref:Reticulon n=1 Tax=Hemibagrus guttatus TaxID=175788 RepID=A0AAE0QLC7_9TELE|nr:hypothetical protein QTP70_026037 [Hemibagrus guttatus]
MEFMFFFNDHICLSECVFLLSVVDLLYWRDVGKTGLVFTGLVVGLACLFQLSAISLLSNLGLGIMAFTLPVRLLFKTMDLVRLNDGSHPFQSYLDEDSTLTDETTVRVVEKIVLLIATLVKELKGLFFINSVIDSLKFVVLLYLLTYVGVKANGLTLVIAGVICAFSLPLAYRLQQFGSLGYTIMGKTADLTVVQKTIIDTLHKEGKPQTFIAKEAGCSQSAVSKHVNRKLSGRRKCGRKRCTTNRENRSLMRIVKQNPFKNLSELHKEWTEAGVKASRATTHRHVKEFGYSCRIPLVKPLLNHRQRQRRLTWAKEKKNWTVAQWSKVLFSDESKFCISFGNQGPRVWRKDGEVHSPSCLKSSVKFPQSVMIWGAMSSAGVGPLCFLKTKVTAPVYQEILEHFMLPSADQLFEDVDFIFQQDLALPTLPKAPEVG